MQNKTKILFYSESNQLSGDISLLKLNSLYFDGARLLKDRVELNKVLSISENKILFYVAKELNTDQRLYLKSLINHSDAYIVLCSDRKNAYDAWSFDLLHFLELPVSQNSINTALKKYLNQISKGEEKMIKIRYNGGLYTIAPAKILYCKGAGNYTNIFLRSGKKILVTAQLNKINQMLIGAKGIERVGKSFILNLTNIQSIGKGEISFFGNHPVKMKISDNYIRKVKKLLLGT